ncbi:hypothetical protein [Glycomyces niveus]|uniref:DUF5666 domain-containing protein n=1 Tax=Glycomyces niveus TaxID=2820287 RepID=A0ABS3UBN1_9ACTN|nr:hypothetical protein [Glycomyces sp. NEAU-S30]MBO3735851.1 hypothetical protein [Glycomyces sp. NEAU-S30]
MSSTLAPAWRSTAAAGLLALFALAGCSESTDDSGSTGTTGTTASAEPTEEPTPSAADGTDFSTCNIRCEVEVTAGDVFEYEAFTMTVADIAADQIELSRDNGAGSTGSASITPGCTAFLTESGTGTVCHGVVDEVPPEPQVTAGQVAVDVLHLGEDGTAIIRIVAG